MSQSSQDASTTTKDKTLPPESSARVLDPPSKSGPSLDVPVPMSEMQSLAENASDGALDQGIRESVISAPTGALDGNGGSDSLPKQSEASLEQLQRLNLASTSPVISSPTKDLPATPPTPPPAEKEYLYLDPTPKTPQISRASSQRITTSEEHSEEDASHSLETGQSEKRNMSSNDSQDQEPQSEIQNIMDQFMDETGAPRHEEIMSPRLELAGSMLGVAGQFPPRKSSLEPLRLTESAAAAASHAEPGRDPSSPPPVPPKPSLTYTKSPPSQPLTPASPTSFSGQPPPPEPEPDQPFDFHRFLEQLRHKSADPVAKFLRSFLTEFGKKQWMVHEQVKIIGDFLAFIANKMALCDVWREVSDTEFDNAKEGMEKLVMNRLYAQTFSPAIPSPAQPPRAKGRRRDPEKLAGPGRRGQHQEDVERDEILAQKIRIYGWVKEEHLDIAPVGPSGEKFLKLAQQELLKMKGYRAPRDKVICILNCCKVIFGLLKNAKFADTSADSFVPLLIYVVLQANPEHLVSNIQYILRFRNQDKLGGEAGYYLSSLSGAVQFVESLDRTSLTITDEEFERNVELAVSEIAEKNRELEMSNSPGQYVSEKSRLAEPEITPRNSTDATYSSPNTRLRNETSLAESEENAAVAGLLRTIQRPLSTIGRIFSEEGSSQTSKSGPASTPQPGSTPRLSPSVFQVPRDNNTQDASKEGGIQNNASNRTPRLVQNYDAQEAAARQASAEAAEARRIQRAEHKNVVEYRLQVLKA
jgi:Rab5 GDP/GTP exchange factor